MTAKASIEAFLTFITLSSKNKATCVKTLLRSMEGT